MRERIEVRLMINWPEKTVLITGGTGSFGREFASLMLAECRPKKLIIFSRDELKQFNTRSEGFDGPSVRYFIGDVRDKERLYRAFYGVDIVVHAAAQKQVLSCEYDPFEAIKTNVIGAANVIDAAIDCGVERVIALSTDKAAFPFKILGGFGDGGAVTTNDPHVDQMVRRLRYNGEDRQTGEYHCHGQTALLDNVQAAVLDVKLRHLPDWIAHRREIAARYRIGLGEVPGLKLPHFDESKQSDVFQNYVIRARDRDRLRQYLQSRGVETLIHWATPLWEHRALKLNVRELSHTERICREVLSLPMSAETTFEQVGIVVDGIQSFYCPKYARAAGAG
jgi:hypothetical protein